MNKIKIWLCLGGQVLLLPWPAHMDKVLFTETKQSLEWLVSCNSLTQDVLR